MRDPGDLRFLVERIIAGLVGWALIGLVVGLVWLARWLGF